MHRWVRFKLEVGRRALGFCQQHPSPNPGVVSAVEELHRLVTHAEQLELLGVSSTGQGLAATARRAELRRLIRGYYLRSLLGILDAVALMHPGRVNRWRLPLFKADDRSFAGTVRAAAAEARRVEGWVSQHGFPPAAVDEMLALLAEWDQCGRRQDEARRTRVGARAGLEAATDRILEVLQSLDVLFRLEYEPDPALRAEWESARHIPWPHRPCIPVAE